MNISWPKFTKNMMPSGAGQARPATRAERGQALLVIALAMIGLLAFVGLTIDSGILFIAEGHLRRAVDAAALAAAAQFRVGSNSDRLLVSANEVVRMNGVDSATLTLGICSPGDQSANPPIPPDPHNDPTLCPLPGLPHRKLVKVTATTLVRFAFLGIVGWPSTTIQADSTSETASVDVVLVIDTSDSMTFDAVPGDPMRSPAVCNAAPNPDPTYTGNCHPFDSVKHAAVDFINHLYWPYDRLSIVTFDRVAGVVEPINNTDTVATWQSLVKALTVSPPRNANTDPLCTYPPDPSACVNTSIGGGLKLAGGQFGVQPIRQESVWVVILLTDGAANASEPDKLPSTVLNRYCPTSTWDDPINDPNQFGPWCRDANKLTRHTVLTPTVNGLTNTVPYNPANVFDKIHYDTDDYARDAADFVACAATLAQAAQWCKDTQWYANLQGGQGALIYAIGLGGLVIDNPKGGGIAYPNAHNNEARIPPSDYTAGTNLQAGYDAGDYLLRYIANVGADGNPDPSVGPDPCIGVPPPSLIPQPVPTSTDPLNPEQDDQPAPVLSTGNLSYNCGNYYYSQFGTGLTSVFSSIASRIFTRITQ